MSFFTAEDFQDPIQEGVYLDMSYEAAKKCADAANAKRDAEIERLRTEYGVMCVDMEQLRLENARLREALELIAAPKRPDGTYNRCREACEQLAGAALAEADRILKGEGC